MDFIAQNCCVDVRASRIATDKSVRHPHDVERHACKYSGGAGCIEVAHKDGAGSLYNIRGSFHPTRYDVTANLADAHIGNPANEPKFLIPTAELFKFECLGQRVERSEIKRQTIGLRQLINVVRRSQTSRPR